MSKDKKQVDDEVVREERSRGESAEKQEYRKIVEAFERDRPGLWKEKGARLLEKLNAMS